LNKKSGEAGVRRRMGAEKNEKSDRFRVIAPLKEELKRLRG
jgi:hypothetical protein